MFSLARGQDPLPEEHFIWVLEPDAWEEVWGVVERSRILEILSGRFPGSSWGDRGLWFGEGHTATMRGLTAVTYYLVAVPGVLEIDPARIEVREGDLEATLLRWRPK